MKFIIFILIYLSFVFSYAQSAKTSQLLKEIEGFYEVDNNGNVTYVRIFEDLNLNEKEIFDRANSYLIYKYNDANSSD